MTDEAINPALEIPEIFKRQKGDGNGLWRGRSVSVARQAAVAKPAARLPKRFVKLLRALAQSERDEIERRIDKVLEIAGVLHRRVPSVKRRR